MAMKEFTEAWQLDKEGTLHRDFQKNPEKILDQYQITGTERNTLLEAAKKGGKAVDARVSTLQGKLIR